MSHRYLRKALPTDRKRYLKWMRDPELRKEAFGIETEDYENDRVRFEEMLADENCECYVYMDFFMAIGEKRIYKKADGKSETRISVAEEFRGQGFEEELAADEKAPAKKGTKAVRDSRFETLRVLCMLMIITMHYLLMSGRIALTPDKDSSLPNLAAWFVEALCLGSVNVYVMISGYYSVDSRFSLRKFIRLCCEVLFYSVTIAAVSFVTGIESLESRGNLFELQYIFMPVQNGHYWFATAYLMLMLFAPFLGMGFKKLNELQHRFILICLLVFCCLGKSFFPLALGPDDFGCGLRWFLVLYVLAAYIRLYGLPFAKTKLSAFLLYVIAAAAMIPWMIFMGSLERGIGLEKFGVTLRFPDATKLANDYNSLPVLLASIGLFLWFLNMKKKEGGIFSKIAKLAPFCFGVYLIHAHIYLNKAENWAAWFKADLRFGLMRIPHMIGVVLLIFIVCVIIDVIRSVLFEIFERFCDWALKIYYAKKELWDYLIAGFAATVMSWVTYYIFAMQIFSFMEDTIRVLLGNAVSWTITVIFAYVINRVFVFHSETKGLRAVGKEFLEFVAARLFSFGVEELIMFVFATLLHMNEVLVKVLIASIVVIVLNYILSKLWIFKDPKKKEAGEKKA